MVLVRLTWVLAKSPPVATVDMTEPEPLLSVACVGSHARYAIGALDLVAAPGMPKEERQTLARPFVSATYA